jgi:hypothetical protein
MSTGDENRDRDPLHFILKYISHRLEPEPITDSSLELSSIENITFLGTV